MSTCAAAQPHWTHPKPPIAGAVVHPGHDIEMADAEQAYVQAPLRGTETWVALPDDQVPAAWWSLGFKRPVCRLKRALYGHPDAGTMWEDYADEHVRKIGFEPLGPEWPSCYYMKRLQLFLVIYVDDFKLAGPKKNIAEGWKLLRQGLNIEDAKPWRYSGC